MARNFATAAPFARKTRAGFKAAIRHADGSYETCGANFSRANVTATFATAPEAEAAAGRWLDEARASMARLRDEYEVAKARRECMA